MKGSNPLEKFFIFEGKSNIFVEAWIPVKFCE